MATEEQLLEERIVYSEGDHHYRYRATIIEDKPTLFFKRRFRFVIEKHFIGWNHFLTSTRFKSKDRCIEEANLYLDRKESPRNLKLRKGK